MTDPTELNPTTPPTSGIEKALGASTWRPVIKAIRAAVLFCAHVLTVIVVLFAIWAIERFTQYLWGNSDPLFFDKLPVRYFFDAMEVGVLTIWIWYALVEAIIVLRERMDQE
jgi:hypothetical protein